MAQLDNTPIATCSQCQQQLSLRELVEDPQYLPQGMRFAGQATERNEIYFEHRSPSCGATFTVPALYFAPLIDEHLTPAVPLETEECGRHCFAVDDLSACEHSCLYAPFRRLLLRLREGKAAG
ncbi:MAG: hypothetical protein IPL40_14620 [Proteobacteria bacterium]|nr:hypothetical protein [Pseudomonadota bacterium]